MQNSSRYLKPIYAKPANLNNISNQNSLIKTKSIVCKDTIFIDIDLISCFMLIVK